MIYAEVIGDPIAQSKSPLIHRRWLTEAGIDADYRACQVTHDALGAYLSGRRDDRDWRGCNVTIPHKQAVMAHLDRIDTGAEAIGAVNLIVREGDGLLGRNTDIDGVAAALDGTDLEGKPVSIIGAGGGARAALAYLKQRGADVTILVRDPAKAAPLRGDRVTIRPIAEAAKVFAGTASILNASPMGMIGSASMPDDLIAAVAANARGRTLFDMVYKPLETPFLAAGRAQGATMVDGLTMLIGQARAAFEAFFGAKAPADDPGLRELLSAE